MLRSSLPCELRQTISCPFTRASKQTLSCGGNFWKASPGRCRPLRYGLPGITGMGLLVKISGLQFCTTVRHMLSCPNTQPMSYSKLLDSIRLYYYWSYVSSETERPVAWLMHDDLGLRFHLRRSHQGVRSFLLPMKGDELCRFRDFEVRLLPKLAFFALWDTSTLGMPALISEYLHDDTVEDCSDGKDLGGPLPGNAELPTTSPTVLFLDILSATNPATIMNPDVEVLLVAVALENFLGAAGALLRQRY